MKTLFIALLLFSFTKGLAQTTSTSMAPRISDVQWAPSFGVMLTNFQVSRPGFTYRTSRELGFMIGVNAYIPSDSPYFDYDSGLYFWNSRTRVESTFSVATARVMQNSLIEMRRLSLPLVLNFYPFRKTSGLFTRVGVLNHFLLDITESAAIFTSRNPGLSTTSQSINRDTFITDKNSYKSYSLDGMLGVGYQSIGAPISLSVELSYLYGLTPAAARGGAEIRTDSLNTSFGIGF